MNKFLLRKVLGLGQIFFCIACCFYSLGAVQLFAQGAYQYNTYTQENGLSSGTIRGIKKDKTGFIWLMSENGLTRFDGYTFKKFH